MQKSVSQLKRDQMVFPNSINATDGVLFSAKIKSSIDKNNLYKTGANSQNQ